MWNQKFRLYASLCVNLLFQWHLEKNNPALMGAQDPTVLKTKQTSMLWWFPTSLLLTISWFLSSWVPLAGHRKVMQLRASGGLYCRAPESGSSDPKFNNMGWYLGVKTSACGICWTPPPNVRAGQHYRGRAPSLGGRGLCVLLPSCSCWWSPGSWALKSLLFPLRSGYGRWRKDWHF